MAIYKIDDILNSVSSMKKDGYEYIEISELPEDEDGEACIYIDAVMDKNSTESDVIDAVKLPDDYICPNQLEF